MLTIVISVFFMFKYGYENINKTRRAIQSFVKNDTEGYYLVEKNKYFLTTTTTRSNKNLF